jgi:DNA invertase Pin-like site-specific DNA recombinase
MATAIYMRVSSKQQSTASQKADLEAYQRSLEAKGESVAVYSDKFTGKTLSRPGWEKLWADLVAGKIDRIVVWRLDRLGRTVSGLSKLFEDLISRKVTLVSIRDALDLSTAAGRLMANVLASVAAFELEVKTERQLAGIAAAQADIRAGRREKYGSGRKPGLSIAPAVQQAIRAMKDDGKPISEIATICKLSRPTVYRVLKEGVPVV